MLPYNPYITVDVFTKGKMNDLRKYNNTAIRDPAPDVTTTSSIGRKSPFLDSSGIDPIFSKNMYNGNNSGDQLPQPPLLVGAQHTMGQGMAIGQANSNVQNSLPWLTHLDRQLINSLELIHVSTVKPHELTQTACRWNEAFDQPSIVANNVPAKISYPYAHNWPWFDENTRLYRFLEAVGVSPLQAGEAMHGRALGKVNVNTMHSEEVFQAIADAKPAVDTTGPNNFTVTEANTAFKKLTGDATLSYSDQRPILSFGQANYTDGMGVKNGLNKSLLGYQVANNKPYENFLDNLTPDPNNPPNPLFPSTGTNVATYARKELLTKIGNSVTTKSNVFAVWITTGYFEVRDDSTQPPKLGAEIGKADSINIRHRMFAIVDRTNMVNAKKTDLAVVFNTNVNGLMQDITGAPLPPINLGKPVLINPANNANINLVNGMIVTIDANTDYEETVSVVLDGNGDFWFTPQKLHNWVYVYPMNNTNLPPISIKNSIKTIINRGNPGPWVGYDRTKDRDVVPYAEIIE
jgi:hypothetical protein